MGVIKQFGDGQLVRTARQASTTGLAGRGIHRFPPVSGPADQVVTLLSETDQVMAEAEVAQTKQLRNRNILRTGQAGLALTTEGVSKYALSVCLEAIKSTLFPGIQWIAGMGKLFGQLEIVWCGGSHRQR